jgi:CheY-like chemotaxis protein
LLCSSYTSSLNENREISKQTSQSEYPYLNGLRLLLVDDNEDCLDMVMYVFKEYQTQVITTQSVDEALKTIEEWKPDVLISDICMPDKDGYSLIRFIRNQEAKQGGFLPAIAVTGYACLESGSEVLKAGFQAFFCKPFDPDKLVATVAKLTQRNLLVK